MKKILLLAAALTVLHTAPTHAQDGEKKKSTNGQYLSLGPVAGIGMNWVSNMGGSIKNVASGNIGIGMIYAKNEHWGFGGQLLVSSEGYDITYGGNEAKATPLYLRLPLRAYYFFGDYKHNVRPKVYLGPTLGFKMSEDDNFTNATYDVNMANNTGTFKSFDLGVNVGAGVNIKLAKALWLNLDLTYYQGVLDVIDDHADHYNTNQNLGFSAGLLFGLKN